MKPNQGPERPSVEIPTEPEPHACFYRGVVRHRRFTPKEHKFSVGLFYPFLNVDAVERSLRGIPFWSVRLWSPMQFRRKDYFDRSDSPLGDAIRLLVNDELGKSEIGRVMLLANVRTWGINFNPLSVYFCYAQEKPELLECIILEVTNTPWNDRHWYVIDAPQRGSKNRATVAKSMHVSPFLPPTMTYDITFTNPDERLSLRIEALEDGNKVFDADLSLKRGPLNARNGILLPFRYPLLPLQVLAGIYAHAVFLFAKRVPFYGRSRSDNLHKTTRSAALEVSAQSTHKAESRD